MIDDNIAATAATGFTWLGLTQETALSYPLSGKRAAWYSVGVGLIVFGLFTALVVLFGNSRSVYIRRNAITGGSKKKGAISAQMSMGFSSLDTAIQGASQAIFDRPLA